MGEVEDQQAGTNYDPERELMNASHYVRIKSEGGYMRRLYLIALAAAGTAALMVFQSSSAANLQAQSAFAGVAARRQRQRFAWWPERHCEDRPARHRATGRRADGAVDLAQDVHPHHRLYQRTRPVRVPEARERRLRAAGPPADGVPPVSEGHGSDRRRDEVARYRDGADHQRPVPAADQGHPGTAERRGVARQHAGYRPGETAVHQRVHQQLSRRRSSLHAEIQSVRLGQDRRPHDQLHPPDPDECIRPEGPERQRQGHCGLAWESSESRLRIPRDRTVPPADGHGDARDCDRVRAALYARPHSRRGRRCARQCLVQRQQKPVRRECWIPRPAR